MKVTNAPAARVLARAAILFAALSALCLLLAGCGRAGARRPRSRPRRQVGQRESGPSTRRAYSAAYSNQPYVTVTGGRFYVTWQNQPRRNVPSTTLVRADRVTGRIEATRTFGTGYISAPQAAGGSLWALLATTQETLLRMNPAPWR